MLLVVAGLAWASEPIRVQPPIRVPTPALQPQAAPLEADGSEGSEGVDCRLAEADYYTLRHELKELRQAQGSSIGVAASGRQCEIALDTVIRNGPFLGVQRVEPGASNLCTAVLRGPSGSGDAGWSLTTVGDCRGDSDRDGLVSGPTRILSVGWWLPFGVSARWNEELGAGFSAVLDMGWQLPASDSPFDLTANTAPTGPATTVRPMAGFDLTCHDAPAAGLAGTFLGFRAGAEIPLVVDNDPFDPDLGLVSFLVGRKWVARGLALQSGVGAVAEIPMLDVGPKFGVVYPMLELRAGLAGGR